MFVENKFVESQLVESRFLQKPKRYPLSRDGGGVRWLGPHTGIENIALDRVVTGRLI